MKIVPEKSERTRQRYAPNLKGQEFVESVEDHQSNDESPEDHCADGETNADPSRLHTKLSHGSR
jgi:hypothetical protein